MSYAELCTMSNFTFLTGASHAEELVERGDEVAHRGSEVRRQAGA